MAKSIVELKRSKLGAVAHDTEIPSGILKALKSMAVNQSELVDFGWYDEGRDVFSVTLKGTLGTSQFLKHHVIAVAGGKKPKTCVLHFRYDEGD